MSKWMQCTSPLIRAETKQLVQAKDGHWYNKPIFLPRSTYDEWQRKGLEYQQKEIERRELIKAEPIGCGQCLACKLNYSRDRATLLMMEKIYHEKNTVWFVTLTYTDEMLYFHTYKNKKTGQEYTGASLNVEHTQLFFKTLRDKFPKAEICYVIAGEYGSKTMRPHYHIILFGCPIDITKLELWSRNEWNQPVWRCKELEEVWEDKNLRPKRSRGMVMIGEVTWESCAYVCRYTLKKADNSRPKEWYYMQGLIPEFIHWSNHIGDQYFIEHQRDIIETDAVPIKNKKTGSLVKPPLKFYRRLGEYYPEVKELIKEKRVESGYAQAKALITDMSMEEYRDMANKKLKNNFKDIRRTV